jgi:hypothetical protein
MEITAYGTRYCNISGSSSANRVAGRSGSNTDFSCTAIKKIKDQIDGFKGRTKDI